MRKYKWLAAVLAATMLLSMMPAFAAADGHETGCQILYAGQNTRVGTVCVENTEDEIWVTYKLDPAKIAEGWVFTELHLAIAEDFAGLPKNSTGNPVPGHFEHKEYFDITDGETEWTFKMDLADIGEDGVEAGAKVFIAAHAVVEKAAQCEVILQAPYGGSEVVAYAQGLRYDYTAVRAQRSNPNAVLTFTTGANEANFFSLGFQEDRVEYEDVDDAWIVVKFDPPILNGPGNDLRIVEDTWGLPYPDETANVWVSQDGLIWAYLGQAKNQTPWLSYHTITDFDLDSVGLAWVSYVKVQDTSNRADFASRYPGQAATLDGFDVNAILSLQAYVECTPAEKETAWADGTRFVNRGNWATYFCYNIKGWVEFEESFAVILTSPLGTTSEKSLTAGEQYKFVVSGTWNNRADEWVDAQYVTYDSWATVHDGPSGGFDPKLLDLQVNAQFVDWGDYNDQHVYELLFDGNGSTVNFRVFDGDVDTNTPYPGWYGDNQPGLLTVTIYIWQ